MGVAEQFLTEAGAGPKPISLASQFASDVSGPLAPAPSAAATPSAIDAPNAVGTGFWRGLVRLAGLPTDTAANVIDLGKAALGAPYIAATGKPVPEWLEPTDRSKVVGSGDYLLDKVRGARAGSLMVDPMNPEYEGGFLQNAGGALTAVGKPNSYAELLKQTLLGQTAGFGGKVAMDATGNPAYAQAAAMAPQGGAYYGAKTIKHAIRGGEAGRQEMVARINALEDAGVTNPTMGLASGNPLVGGMENLLQSTPGAMNVMGGARDRAIVGLRAKAGEAADMAAPVTMRGAWEAGRNIQSGIEGFKGDFKARQGALYDALEQAIGGQTPTKVDATRQALAILNQDIHGAPELSEFFKNGRIQALEAAMTSDVGAANRAPPTRIDPIYGTVRQDIRMVNPAAGTLPFEAVKKTRTLVGNEIADNSLISSVPRSKWNPLYGALSQDMQAAAATSGADATNAFNRANNYTRAGIDRLERLAPFADKNAPEQAFTSLMQTTKENASILQTVKKSLPEGARGAVAGTAIDRLGRANPGQQNDLGDSWSSERFLTNWNTMSPKAREELFSGFKNSGDVKAAVDAVAKASSMMRENSKLWANPSGTGANLAARATFAAPLVPLLSGGAPDPYVMGGVLAATGGARMLAKALTSKDVVNAVANKTALTQNDVESLLKALSATGQLSPQK